MFTLQNAKRTLVWFFTIALGLGMLASAIPKFMDPEGWRRRFEIFGVSSDLLFIVAFFEILAVILLLIPKTASIGAAVISVIMATAVWSHFSSDVGDPTTAIVYLIAAITLAMVQRQKLFWLRIAQK